MDLFNFDPATMLSFLLTLMRMSVILFLLPFFGSSSAPTPAKAALCLIMTLALFPEISVPGELMPAHPVNIALMIAGEATIGLVLSLIVRVIFASVQTGGSMIGFQMGFSMVNAIDPMSGEQESAIAHFLYMVTMMTFLVLNGHLILLKGFAETFTVVPPGSLYLHPELGESMTQFAGQMLVVGIKVAGPVIAAIILMDLALALISRSAPQMHLLTLGFPLKISVGFFFVSMMFSMLARHIEDFISNLGFTVHTIMSLMAPVGG